MKVIVAGNNERTWRPFRHGGFLDVDTDELDGFGDAQDWDFLDDNSYGSSTAGLNQKTEI
jgi:hypothetical protein